MKENICIDRDIVNSLWGLYFGAIQDKYMAAVYRAYRDFNRTIDFPQTLKNHTNDSKEEKKKKENCRISLRNQIVDLMKKEIQHLHGIKLINNETFNEWHTLLCRKIISIYHSAGVTAFSYGQAQKWVNMTIKYLYLLQEDSFEREFPYLHIPVDKFVLDIAKKQFGVAKPKEAWSTWSELKYKEYQTELQDHIQNQEPLRWEFRHWLEAARGFEETTD